MTLLSFLILIFNIKIKFYSSSFADSSNKIPYGILTLLSSIFKVPNWQDSVNSFERKSLKCSYLSIIRVFKLELL